MRLTQLFRRSSFLMAEPSRLGTGKLAKQADGSVMLRMGNTMLLATVCAAKDAVPGTDFMPAIKYKEKFSAFGRSPGFAQNVKDALLTTKSSLAASLTVLSAHYSLIISMQRYT